MSFFKATWTNSISRVFGKFASTQHPSFLQVGINKLYTNFTGVDLANFEPHSHYKTLNELFTRELKYARDFSKDPAKVISPCDSLISAQGNIENNTALQIKGFSYDVGELLTSHIDSELVGDLNEGTFMNFYLSPKDYHRYHVPMDMKVKKVIHVPGLLYPVNFKYLNKVPSLFVKNERVVLECYDMSERLFFIVLVGALNVGKMTLSFESKIDTNVAGLEARIYEYEESIELSKGEELGMFMMGSTIAILFEKDFVELEDKIGKNIRFADVIATKRP